MSSLRRGSAAERALLSVRVGRPTEELTFLDTQEYALILHGGQVSKQKEGASDGGEG